MTVFEKNSHMGHADDSTMLFLVLKYKICVVYMMCVFLFVYMFNSVSAWTIATTVRCVFMVPVVLSTCCHVSSVISRYHQNTSIEIAVPEMKHGAWVNMEHR